MRLHICLLAEQMCLLCPGVEAGQRVFEQQGENNSSLSCRHTLPPTAILLKGRKKTHCYKGDACLEPNTYQVLLAPHHPAGLSSGTVLIPSRSAKLLVAPQVRPQALSVYSLRICQTALVWRAQHTSATNPMRQCALPASLHNPTNCPPSHPTRKVPVGAAPSSRPPPLPQLPPPRI